MSFIHITYIVSQIDKALEFEWVAELLNKNRFQLSFISINNTKDTALYYYCQKNSIPFYHINFRNKVDVFTSTFQTYRLLVKIKPNIVHAHLFEGGLIGITAAWLAGINTRIYTRHYSNYHHKYAPNGVKFDKWINAKATHIISITQMVTDILILKEKVPANKITLIHHGFPIENFLSCSEERITNLKLKNQIPSYKKNIGVVSKYMFLKGLQDIIPAFQQLYKENKNVHLVLANAHGDYKIEIKKLLNQLPNESYTEILFEKDNVALFKCFDIFIHAPIDIESEAFGQIYIEALLTETPSIFTISGIAADIIIDKKNAIVIPYQNTQAIYDAMKLLLSENQELIAKLKLNGLEIAKEFSIEKKISALEKLYTTLSCQT